MPMGGVTPVRKRAGQRRTRITLWATSEDVDSLLSQQDGEWAQFGTDDAAIDEIPFVMNESEHGMLHKVTIKYRTDVVEQFNTDNTRVQIRGGGLTLNVLEIENAERRNIELILHCAPSE